MNDLMSRKAIGKAFFESATLIGARFFKFTSLVYLKGILGCQEFVLIESHKQLNDSPDTHASSRKRARIFPLFTEDVQKLI